MLRALIFDVDGTLAETEEAHRQAFNRSFADHGLPWEWDRALYRLLLKVTGGRERIRHFLSLHHPGRLDDGGIEALIGTLHTVKTGHYTRMVKDGGVALRPGIRRLMDEARAAGVRLAIATTTSRVNIEELLKATLGEASLSWFDAWGCGEDVTHKKPHPEVYEVVLHRLGLPGSACLALEDSANGMRAARGAGVPVAVTPSSYTDDETFAGPLAVFHDLSAVGLADLRRLVRGG